MTQYWLMCLIQLLGVVAFGLAISLFLPDRVRWLIHKNATRMDGSFSRRRYQIERTSFWHCIQRVWVVLILAFLAINAVAFVFWPSDPVENFAKKYELKGFRQDPESGELIQVPPSQGSGRKKTDQGINEWNFTYVVILLVGWFVIALTLVANRYQSAIKTYESHANQRFHEYYLQRAVHQ